MARITAGLTAWLLTLLLPVVLLLPARVAPQPPHDPSRPVAGTMRCPAGHLVSRGDTTSAVLIRCGEPTQREKHYECRAPHREKLPAEGPGTFPAKGCITVEVWTYNFGPYSLVHSLTFKEDHLAAIRTHGYGQ